MTNKEFADELEKRTRRFAVRIIKLSAKLPNTTEGRIVRNQLTKAGTSIGANYREANRGWSNADFAYRIKISESEGSETVYWLGIVMDMHWLPISELEADYKEAKELLAIFTSIRKNSKPK